MTKQTFGQYRIGVSFNPSQNPLVDEIKRKAAELIDLIDSIPNDRPDIARRSAEIGRTKALASTHVEDAAMWAVKAATKPAPETDE